MQFVAFATFSLMVKLTEQKLFGAWASDHFFFIFRGNWSHLLGWSLAVLAGLAHAHFRDTKHMLEIGFQILFYMTPVFYDADALRGARLEMILRFNPVVPFLHLLRYPLLHGGVPDATTYARACVIVALTVSLAVAALAKLERRLIFHL